MKLLVREVEACGIIVFDGFMQRVGNRYTLVLPIPWSVPIMISFSLVRSLSAGRSLIHLSFMAVIS